MKKALIMSVLGATTSLAMMTTANAQGYIMFENYDSASGLNAPVTFNYSGLTVPGGVTPSVAGNGVGSEFTADLLYSLDGGSTWIYLTQANSGVSFSGFGGYPTPFGLGSTTDGPVDHTTTFAGYFFGGAVEIPGYTSGPAWFIVEVYNGTSYADSVGVGFYRGQSAPIEINSLATGAEVPGTFGPAFSSNGGMQAFTVGPLTPPLPEPATLALGGLGLATLMLFRRSRKS